MAEALANHFRGATWEAYSAGTRPTGYVHPLGLKAVAELGVSTRGLISKNTDALRDITFDRVYTVCDSAAEDCPIWLGEGDVRHIPFYDPAEATGTDDEIFAVFTRVRNEIMDQIINKLDEPDAITA